MFLDLRHKVIQAPMAGSSTPQLAAAVSNAGGLGFIALGAMNTEEARAAITRTRALTDRPFGVNLFCHAPARRDPSRERRWLDILAPEFARFGAAPPDTLHEIYASFKGNDAMTRVLLEQRPAFVSFHFGLPLPEQIAALRASGAVLLATATSVNEARAIVKAGLDGIVAQGWQAGGHRGIFDPKAKDDALETLPLLAQLAGLGLPLIAAGGIMTREDARAAIMAGAAAVQCGTAYLLAPEAATPPAHRKALIRGRTTMTRAISGRPARCAENLFTRIEAEAADIPDYPVAYDAGKALNAAALAQGEAGYGAHWSGTGGAKAVARPAAETTAVISP